MHRAQLAAEELNASVSDEGEFEAASATAQTTDALISAVSGFRGVEEDDWVARNSPAQAIAKVCKNNK